MPTACPNVSRNIVEVDGLGVRSRPSRDRNTLRQCDRSPVLGIVVRGPASHPVVVGGAVDFAVREVLSVVKVDHSRARGRGGPGHAEHDANALTRAQSTGRQWISVCTTVSADQSGRLDVLELVSGCSIEAPLERLKWFCEGEYAYYDAIPSANPNRIDPLDVLVTVAVNSFVNSASNVHRVHQGMAANCEPILATIPEDADLLDFNHSSGPLRELLHAAVQIKGVLIPVATKVTERQGQPRSGVSRGSIRARRTLGPTPRRGRGKRPGVRLAA